MPVCTSVSCWEEKRGREGRTVIEHYKWGNSPVNSLREQLRSGRIWLHSIRYATMSATQPSVSLYVSNLNYSQVPKEGASDVLLFSPTATTTTTAKPTDAVRLQRSGERCMACLRRTERCSTSCTSAVPRREGRRLSCFATSRAARRP